MNWLDIVILVIVALSVFTGLKNGLIKTAFSLAGLIIGIFLAGNYYLDLAEVLSFIPNESLAQVLAFIIILSLVSVVASLLAMILKKVAHAVMLGWVDRLGGAGIGFVLGAISVAALLTLWIKFTSSPPDAVTDSALASVLLDKFPVVLSMLPDEFDAVRSFFE